MDGGARAQPSCLLYFVALLAIIFTGCESTSRLGSGEFAERIKRLLETKDRGLGMRHYLLRNESNFFGSMLTGASQTDRGMGSLRSRISLVAFLKCRQDCGRHSPNECYSEPAIAGTLPTYCIPLSAKSAPPFLRIPRSPAIFLTIDGESQADPRYQGLRNTEKGGRRFGTQRDDTELN